MADVVTQRAAVRHIIANRFDGLGGRLLNLLYSRALAAHLGAELLVHWPESWDLSARSLDHLFAAECDAAQWTPRAFRLEWLDFARDSRFRAVRMLAPHDRLEPGFAAAGFDTLVNRSVDPAAIAVEPHFPPERLNHDARLQASRWLVHPRVAERVARFADRFELGDAMGVHIRRGDVPAHPDPAHRARYVARDRYLAALDALDSDRAIFVASDSPGEAKALRRRYGRRVVTLGTRGVSRSAPRQLQAAFAEILLLARCGTLIAGASNFARAAAVIGGRPVTWLAPEDGDSSWDAVRGNWGL